MARGSGKVTRADVARLAGVSPSVVSFTLNGGPRPVAADTAARVLEAVEELGYIPNAAARALNMGATALIGLVVHDITNPFYYRIAAEVQRVGEAHGLSVVIASTLEDRSRSLIRIRSLDAAQVAGIIATTYLSPTDVAEIARLRTPIVQLDSEHPLQGAVRLVPAFEDASRQVLAHLVDLGHESIAYVGGRSPVDARIEVWQESHRARGVEPGAFAEVEYSRKGGYDGMRQILATETPTAVFAGSGTIAVGALRALHEAGLRVPEDVSLVSFDDIDELEYSRPSITGMRLPIEQMARDAVRSIVDRDSMAPGDHPYATTLVVRESTAPPADRRS